MRDEVLCVCLNPVIQKTIVFSRLEKGEVNRSAEHRVDAAGKGVNVARVLGQRGLAAAALCPLGGVNGGWFLSLCAEDGLKLHAVESDSEIRFCYTILDRADGSATELVEESRPVSPETPARLWAAFERALGQASALVISGTKAPGFPDSLYPAMVEAAKASGIPVALDIKGADLLACLPHRPDVVKPNVQELLATRPLPAGLPETEENLFVHVASLAREWRETYGARLVVTRGSKSTWFSSEDGLETADFSPIAAVNPTGSGDAFTAGLLAALLAGGDLETAVREGQRLGALNAGILKPGSVA